MRLACLQVAPSEDMAANLGVAQGLAREAVREGATLLMLPEYAMVLHASGRVMRSTALPESQHPALPAFRDMAREHGAWVILGSLTIATGGERIANRSFVIDDRGEIVARYDKLHMFDVTLPDGRAIRESSLYQPGDKAVVVATPWGRLGLSICYDLRFPQLYRALAHAGADLVVVPSAFTQATGEMHWHALLRARAIECGAFVAAPATCGEHPGGHRTYGHSLVVDPLGRIVAEAAEGPRVLVADIDLADAAKARARMPTLDHDRPFEVDVVDAT